LTGITILIQIKDITKFQTWVYGSECLVKWRFNLEQMDGPRYMGPNTGVQSSTNATMRKFLRNNFVKNQIWKCNCKLFE
jgi:hypothetical protein